MVRFACPAGIDDALREVTANEDDASYNDLLYDPEGNHTQFSQYATLYYDHNGESTQDGDDRGNVECTYCGRIAYDFDNAHDPFDTIEGRMIDMGYTTRRNCGFNEMVYATPELHAANCRTCTDILEIEEDPFEAQPAPTFTRRGPLFNTPATIHGEWRRSHPDQPEERLLYPATPHSIFDIPQPETPIFRVRAGDGA